MFNIHIAYGSESGNAHTLAYQMKLKLIRFMPELYELNELTMTKLSEMTEQDILIIFTSTTGDGEAPYNASKFYQSIVRDKSSIHCQYAVFGLGDVKYPNFCGFSIMVDGFMEKKGATAIANRVDADVDFEPFYETWSEAVFDYLCARKSGDIADTATTQKKLTSLMLQVDPNS